MPQNPGLTFLGFQKVNPLSNPKGVHFGTPAWAKKNAQNYGFEHFGTFGYPRYAEREVLEPFLVLP